MQLVSQHRLCRVRQLLLHLLTFLVRLHEHLNKVLRPQKHERVRSTYQILHRRCEARRRSQSLQHARVRVRRKTCEPVDVRGEQLVLARRACHRGEVRDGVAQSHRGHTASLVSDGELQALPCSLAPRLAAGKLLAPWQHQQSSMLSLNCSNG